MPTLDEIIIPLRAKVDKIEKQLKGVKDKGMQAAGSIKDAFKGIVAGAAIKGLQVFGKSAIEASIQTETFRRRAETVFKTAFPQLEARAKETASALGLTKTEFIGAASAAGDLLVPLGFTREEAAKTSSGIVELAGKLKEFNADSRSTQEIAGVLTKAFLGEREGLKSLGISVDEADIKVELLRKGKEKLTGQALKLEKALITEELVFRKTTDAQAAFETGAQSLSRTFNTLQAQTREVKEGFLNFVGEGLTPLLEGFSDISLGNVTSFFSTMSTGTKTIITLAGAFAVLAPAIGTLLTSLKAFGGFSSLFSLVGGPWVAGIVALSVAVGALAIAMDKFSKTTESLIKDTESNIRSNEKLITTIKKLESQSELTETQIRQ
jgi:hypothetical protein